MCPGVSTTVDGGNLDSTIGGMPEREHLIRALARVPQLKAEASEKLRFFEKAYRSTLQEAEHLRRVFELEGSATSKRRND
jgi:hypothetical protein